MNKDTLLRWGLFLLGVFLAIGPFIIALGTHNWDIMEALLPSEAEMAEVKEIVGGLFGGGSLENMLENQGPPTINLTTGEVRAMFNFKSPFKIQVKITDISGGFSCEDNVHLASVQMEEEEVEVQANGTGTFTLVGTLTQEAVQHVQDVHGGVPPTPRPENISFELEFKGVTLRFSMGVIQEGGSR